MQWKKQEEQGLKQEEILSKAKETTVRNDSTKQGLREQKQQGEGKQTGAKIKIIGER